MKQVSIVQYVNELRCSTGLYLIVVCIGGCSCCILIFVLILIILTYKDNTFLFFLLNPGLYLFENQRNQVMYSYNKESIKNCVINFVIGGKFNISKFNIFKLAAEQ